MKEDMLKMVKLDNQMLNNQIAAKEKIVAKEKVKANQKAKVKTQEKKDQERDVLKAFLKIWPRLRSE